MEDLAPFVILALFVSLLALERLAPARPLPAARGWLARGLVWFVLVMTVNALVPLWVAPLVAPYAVLDGQRLGTAGGALVALVVVELVGYWTHRLNHRVHFLWRWFHQMHHSAERVDVAGSVLFHPSDLALNVALQTAAVVVLGVTGESAAIAGVVIAFAGMFQHLNVRTPVWLGYVIQRPEAHSVHHQRGVHAYNYGNFAFSDRLFGTYRNPAEFAAQAGFYPGASSRIAAMLLGRDIGSDPPERTTTRLRVAS